MAAIAIRVLTKVVIVLELSIHGGWLNLGTIQILRKQVLAHFYPTHPPQCISYSVLLKPFAAYAIQFLGCCPGPRRQLK